VISKRRNVFDSGKSVSVSGNTSDIIQRQSDTGVSLGGRTSRNHGEVPRQIRTRQPTSKVGADTKALVRERTERLIAAGMPAGRAAQVAYERVMYGRALGQRRISKLKLLELAVGGMARLQERAR
jgi:hypothetical protein